MYDTHYRFAVIFSTSLVLTIAGACDDTADPVTTDPSAEVLGSAQISPDRAVQTEDWGDLSVPKIADSAAKELVAQAGLAAGTSQCKLDTLHFRLRDDKVAIGTPPGGFFTPFPAEIPTFDAPVLQDTYLFAVTMHDLDGNVVGFATEQEIADLVINEGKTTYTVTLPGRGTLMLSQTESFQVLMDAVNDMIADGVYVRSFDPPLVRVLTLPGTGKVVGGSGEFEGAVGIWHEIGIVNEIDLLNNDFDLSVIVQAYHCSQ